MNKYTKHIILLSVLITLTVASCWGAACNFFKNLENAVLLEATDSGDFDRAILALKKGANINATDKDGRTALNKAIYHSSIDIATELIKQGADVHKANRDGMMPLCLAVKRGLFAIVILLLEKGAKVNKSDKKGCTPLMYAALGDSWWLVGHDDIVVRLLENKAQVDAINKDGQTALMTIAGKMPRLLGSTPDKLRGEKPEYYDKKVVDLLIAAKANVNIATKKSLPALLLAAESGFEILVDQLIVGGADVNFTTKDGRSALFLAACNEHKEIAARLLEAEADINIALEQAIYIGNREAKQLLMRLAKKPELANAKKPKPIKTQEEKSDAKASCSVATHKKRNKGSRTLHSTNISKPSEDEAVYCSEAIFQKKRGKESHIPHREHTSSDDDSESHSSSLPHYSSLYGRA